MPLSRRRFLRQSTLAVGAGLAGPLWRPRALGAEAPPPAAATPGTADAAAAAAPAAGRSFAPAPTPIPAPAGWGVTAGPYQPTWESLAQYQQAPDWFRDAKLGIWAHWGPQCVPEQGDWYAQKMYLSGNGNSRPDPDYTYHVAHYGPPSKFGFKDIDNIWKAEKWDPARLIKLYQRAGAKYFTTMANHHDNLDMFASSYQPWNTVAIGPKKDIVGTWEKLVRAAGLRFGVTVHAAHAWMWYQAAQGADPAGPLAGVPYDGKMTKADGQGLWWDGLDPQDLYAQYHPVAGTTSWAWQGRGGASLPDQAYCDKFFNRTVELISKYNPDLVYYDDTILPLYPVSDVGLRLAAFQYNRSLQQNGGKNEAVITGKGLSEQQQGCLVMDIERGVAPGILAKPWQTDTCIGDWHYSISRLQNHSYKTPLTVVRMLVDIVSKNGNLQLNIPLPGHGEPDSDELAFLDNLTKWMDIGGEAIFATRPWKIYGEGPSTRPAAGRGRGRGGNNGDTAPAYTAQDFRFTQKGDTLYAFAMNWPDDGKLTIQSLADGSMYAPGKVERVELLSVAEPLKFTRDAMGLNITLPAQKVGDYAHPLKISGSGLTA